jgi:hypothetical protein
MSVRKKSGPDASKKTEGPFGRREFLLASTRDGFAAGFTMKAGNYRYRATRERKTKMTNTGKKAGERINPGQMVGQR